MPLISLRIKE